MDPDHEAGRVQQDSEAETYMTEPRVPRLSRTHLVLAGFLAVAAFFLVTEHRAHVLGALPWLLLAACPLMHLMHHHGHSHHPNDASGPRGHAGKDDSP
jgi:hypothetical protein